MTGEDRPLSDEPPWKVEISIRQDLPSLKISYGFGYTENDVGTTYGLDELVVGTYVPGLSAFIERTLSNNYKIRLEGYNLLSQGAHRSRQVYDTSRESNVILYTEKRVRDDDPYFRISISGTF